MRSTSEPRRVSPLLRKIWPLVLAAGLVMVAIPVATHDFDQLPMFGLLRAGIILTLVGAIGGYVTLRTGDSRDS